MKKNSVQTNTKPNVATSKQGPAKPMKSRGFAVPMPGDWMDDPTAPQHSILCGDLLVVDPDETVTDGDIAFLGICGGESWTARRWYSLNDNEVELVADNPDYQPIIKKKQEVEIVGKVIGFARSLEGRKKKRRSVN